MGRAVRTAWLAGLFEGEGCLSRNPNQNGSYWRFQISMTDPDVIRRAQAAAGMGLVSTSQKAPPRRLLWNWKVNQAEHIYAILAAVYPFLGTRRARKALEFFAWYRQRRPLNQCPRGHTAPYPRPAGWKCSMCKRISWQHWDEKRRKAA